MDALFFLKKLIGAMLAPLPLFFVIFIFGVLLMRTAFSKAGKGLITVSVFWLFLSAWPPFAKWIMEPLENAYPKYQNQKVDTVVVLGGWHQSDERVPVTSVLSGFSTSRLLEGIRIAQLNPGSTLYLSGYTGFTDEISNAEAMKSLAMVLGVDETVIHTEGRPLDTYEEAIYIKKFVQQKPFVLVTSASHMRRAMALMQGQGLNPIAAPTNYLAKDNGKRSFFSYWPSSGAMRTTYVAIHEWVGYLWSRLRGQINSG